MGRRGRVAKPTALKLLQGCPRGRRKLPKGEPKPPKIEIVDDRAVVRAPFPLKAESERIFGEVSDHLARLGILTEIDINTLGRYCDIFARWLEAREFLDRHGSTYPVYSNKLGADGKPKLKFVGQFPQVTIYRSLNEQLLRLESQFGLTPAARAALNLVRKSEGSEDEWLRKLMG